ncbi:hypothetical protein LEP1GSC172_3726 [Leptospira noguchii]|uniref:Uncharacterized protein n=1 Tax=Leptospira noguchii TaxID=28182 RepID=M6VGM6_9LEPT|nr:hypothetical protein LEP1GSC172_3726 [Leptospira noguchii]
MIFALEFCLENPKTIFSVIPNDFEIFRENFLFLKEKKLQLTLDFIQVP